jgi:hypothetical protein
MFFGIVQCGVAGEHDLWGIDEHYRRHQVALLAQGIDLHTVAGRAGVSGGGIGCAEVDAASPSCVPLPLRAHFWLTERPELPDLGELANGCRTTD